MYRSRGLVADGRAKSLCGNGPSGLSRGEEKDHSLLFFGDLSELSKGIELISLAVDFGPFFSQWMGKIYRQEIRVR